MRRGGFRTGLRARAVARDETGIVLPMALIVLIVLSALAAAVLAVGTSEQNISSNHLRTAQAAETGPPRHSRGHLRPGPATRSRLAPVVRGRSRAMFAK